MKSYVLVLSSANYCESEKYSQKHSFHIPYAVMSNQVFYVVETLERKLAKRNRKRQMCKAPSLHKSVNETSDLPYADLTSRSI